MFSRSLFVGSWVSFLTKTLASVLTLGLWALPGRAQTPGVPPGGALLPAQNARIREVGEAMQGGGWNVYGNGFLGDWFATPQGGEITARVRAAGDPSANVYPIVRLWINEKLTQTFTVDSTDYRDYEFKATVPAGITRVEVEFTNDTNGETPDRNLRVIDLTVSPATLAPTVPKIGEADIAKYRMGTLVIHGKVGRRVKVTQLKHEFPFGTCLNDQMFRPGPPPLGATWTEADRTKYLETARTWFNAATHENALKWYHTEPKNGEVSYEDADRMLKWCEENGLQMRGHNLFWAVDTYVQDWVKALDNPALEARMKARTNEVVTRYKNRINEFDVNNEMLHGDYYGKRLGEGINAEMFQWAKAANPDAVLYVNDYAILSGPLSDAYFAQIKALQAAGAPVGGIGFQGHFNGGIDLRHVKRTLDRFAALGLPLKVTEYDLKLGTPEARTKTLTDFYRTCFAHPAIAGLTMWGFWDGSHWIPGAGLFNQDWTPKPEAQAYHDLVYKEWWTNTEAVIPTGGVLRVRAFYGTQQIESDGRIVVVQLKKKDGSAEVKLK